SDVISHPGKGLLRCIGQKPETLLRTDACTTVYQDHDPLLKSVISPGGHITSPRCDSSGSGRIILLVYGIILVIWWEFDPKVWNDYGQMHCANKGQQFVNVVKTWPGLKW